MALGEADLGTTDKTMPNCRYLADGEVANEMMRFIWLIGTPRWKEGVKTNDQLY
jgi:hypothetical protein